MTKERDAHLPLVSVVVPTYNRATTVVACLESLRQQRYRPLEVIVVDDGSADNSVEVVETWLGPNAARDFSVQILRQANQGACVARNNGKQAATGIYLQYLDSDDTLEPGKIAEQVRQLEETRADIAVCDFRYIYESDNREKIVRNEVNLPWHMARGGSVSTFTPLIRRQRFQTVDWSQTLRWHQDIDYFLKVFCLAERSVYTPGVYCNYRMHGSGQISDSYRLKDPLCLQRFNSLLSFCWRNARQIPLRNYGICLVGAAFLLGRHLKHLGLKATGRR